MGGELITVFGASGFLGRNTVRELAKRGYRVRAAVRRPHLAGFLKPLGDVGQVQVTQADVIKDRASIARAVAGAYGVVNLVGLLYQTNSQSFAAAHGRAAGQIAEAAAAAGVQKLAHVSAIGADADSEALYAQTKAEGEQAVKQAFPNATILRPSVVFGPQDDFFNRFAHMARYSPMLPAIGGGQTKFQPVYADDVADAICAALTAEDAPGRIYELGGPRVYTFNELMELMLDIIDRKRLLAPMPFPIASLIGLAGQITARLTFTAPVLTSDQVELLKRDNVVGASGEEGVGTLADLGVTPQTLEAVLPSYLERFRRYGQFEPNRVG